MNIVRMLAFVCPAYHFGYYIIIGGVLALTLTELVYELPEDERNQVAGNFGFFFSIGCIVSNFLSGSLTKYIGRVRLILVLEVCRIICALVYRIENLNIFYAMRFSSGFLGGIGIGLVPLIINEIIPKDLTGYGGCLSSAWFSLVMLIASLQSPLLGEKEGLEDHWQNVLTWPLLFSVTAIILDLVTMFGIESPNYYYEHYAENKEVLKEKVLAYAKRFYTDESSDQFTEDFIAEKERIREAAKGNKFTFKSLFGPRYRKQFALGCSLAFLQQMTGINFMIFFSTQLFDDLSGNGSFMTIVLSFGLFVEAAASVFVVNSGRKPGMLYSAIALVLSLVMLLFAINYEIAILASIGMFTYVFSFSLGFSAIYAVYIIEILPPVGAGLAFSVQWVTSAIIGLVGASLLDLIGIQAIIAIFIFFSIVACLVFWFFCNETSGKTEEEIRNSFTG